MRCMCGAKDCGVCYPGARTPVECTKCENVVLTCYYDDQGWGMCGNNDLCFDCLSKTQAELKVEIENILIKYAPIKELTLREVVWLNFEGTSILATMQSAGAIYIEALQDALEDIRQLCEKHNVGVMVRIDTIDQVTLQKSIENAQEVLSEWVTQHGCECGHPACKTCQRSQETRETLEEMK